MIKLYNKNIRGGFMIKDRVTITIDRDVNAAIKELSEKESRSFSQMVNLILKEHVVKKESK